MTCRVVVGFLLKNSSEAIGLPMFTFGEKYKFEYRFPLYGYTGVYIILKHYIYLS